MPDLLAIILGQSDECVEKLGLDHFELCGGFLVTLALFLHLVIFLLGLLSLFRLLFRWDFCLADFKK